MHLDFYSAEALFETYDSDHTHRYIQHQAFIRLTVLYENGSLTNEESERYLIIALTHSYNPNTPRLI